MTRPLTDTRRQALADTLELLAAELRRPDGRRIQDAIGVAADNRYPAAASTVPKQRNNAVDEDGKPIRPDTPVERTALGHDLAAAQANTLLQRQHDIERTARYVLGELAGWRTDRARGYCSGCGHQLPKLPNGHYATRCQKRGCEQSTEVASIRACRVCGQVADLGQPLPAGRCQQCHSHYKRTGRERMIGLTVDGLVNAGVNAMMIADGATGDEE